MNLQALRAELVTIRLALAERASQLDAEREAAEKAGARGAAYTLRAARASLLAADDRIREVINDLGGLTSAGSAGATDTSSPTGNSSDAGPAGHDMVRTDHGAGDAGPGGNPGLGDVPGRETPAASAVMPGPWDNPSPTPIADIMAMKARLRELER